MKYSFDDAHLDASAVRAIQQRATNGGYNFLTNLHLADGTTVPVYDCAESIVKWLSDKTSIENASVMPVVVDNGSRDVTRTTGAHYMFSS